MNALCYKIVFSKRLGALVAVGEHTAGQGKAAGTGVRTAVYPSSAVGATAGEFVGSLKAVFASVALTCFTATSIAAGPAANTLPTGAQVTTGNVAISTNGATMNILQSTDKASVNWNSFSIGSGAAVNVHQNSASSVLLNRVVGNDPSQIFGKLTANGQVILINPNGIVFGKGGSVTASAFTASTFGMTDADFQAGKHKFSRNGSTRGVTVEEGADIHTTTTGGYVALIGASVNNQGEIHTQQGAVVMAAGESVALPTALTDSVGVPLSSKVRLELTPSTINASVENGGTITTDGGQVLMQAAAVADAVASITHTGTIDTTGEQGGAVTLQADHGIIKATGKIKANSNNAKNKGGDIIIGRDDKVDPITSKTTTVLAKATDVRGATLESQGGFVETSGEYLETEAITVKAKDWLLDPSNIEIVPDTASETGTTLPAAPQSGPVNYEATTASRVRAKTIADNLNNGTNVTLSTGVDANSTTGDEGNIVVNAPIEKTGDKSAKLTLIANNRIIVNERIGKKADANSETDTGNLDVDMTAHGNRKTGEQGSVVMKNVIDAGNGKVNITATSKTGWEGLIFQGNSGITAGTYTVKGSSLSTAVRFNGGTATFNSSSGDSLIEGNSAGSAHGGVFAAAGSMIDINTTGSNTKATLATDANSAEGVRFGFGGGVTVNTNGNITIGSHNNNSLLRIQANVNVNGGTLTLQGQSSSDGIIIQDANGGAIKHSIKVNNGSSLVMDGRSSGSGTGITGVLGQHAIEMTGDAAGAKGSINMTGTSTSGTGINTSSLTITSDGGEISLIGKGAGNGLALGSIIKGGNINLEGTSTGASQGIYASNAANIKSDTGVVTIKGTSNTGTATQLQGAVTGQTGVTIEGVTNGVTPTTSVPVTNSRSVLIQNTITAETGNIAVTGKINNNTDTGQRAITLVGPTSKLDAKNGNIELNTDSLFLNTGSATMVNAAGTGKGVVSINTTTEGRDVVLGSSDTANKLGIDQGEIAKIAAQKLIIGNSTKGGAIHIETAINASHIDTLSLQTKSEKTVTQATPALPSTVGSIKANNLEVISGAVTLENKSNAIQTIAAKAASLNFVNNGALTIGEVNGTKGVATTGGASVTTRTGNLTIKENVSNNRTGDVILGAGTDAAANDGLGSNIKVGTTSANVKANISNNGKTFLYTGSTSDTDKLEDLNSSLANLDLSAIDGGKQNADSNVTFKTGTTRNTITDGADVQVMFREKIKIGSLTGVEVSKIYGDANTKDTAQAALLVDTKTTLKDNTANQDNSVSDKTAGTIRISNAALIDSLNGSLNTQSTDFSTSKFLKANETNVYKYGALTSNKYDTSLAADQVTVKVLRKEVTYSGVSVISKEYDGSTSANLNGTPTLGTVLAGSSQANDLKVIESDKVQLSGTVNGTYESPNVIGAASQNGRNNITLSGVNLTAFDNSTDINNYTFVAPTLEGRGTISPKTLSLIGTTVADKSFDGNTSATVTNNGTLNGLVGNETLSVTATGTFNNSSIGNQKPVVITGTLANGTGLASNYRVAPASAVANITEAVKPPVPVVPTDGNSRVKVPVGSANPFALASAEDLADDTCSANSIENCYCEPSELNKQVDICYEPKAGAKGSAR